MTHMAGSDERGQLPDAFALCSSYSNLPLIRRAPDYESVLNRLPGRAKWRSRWSRQLSSLSRFPSCWLCVVE